MKKLFNLVALAGMFMLMSFSSTNLEPVNDCKSYASGEVVNASAAGINNSFWLGAVYGYAIAECEEANEQGATIFSVWLK